MLHLTDRDGYDAFFFYHYGTLGKKSCISFYDLTAYTAV